MSGWLGNKQVYPSPELKNGSGETEFTMEEGISLFQYTCIELLKGAMGPMAGRYDEEGMANLAIAQAVVLIKRMEDAQILIHQGRWDELVDRHET